MNTLQYELYKVKREIQLNGSIYEFIRYELDNDKQPTNAYKTIAKNSGLFHLSKGFISPSMSDGTTSHTKGQPMLLLAYEDTTIINNGDFVNINGSIYKVIEKGNIQEMNIIVDLSLEVVLNGRN